MTWQYVWVTSTSRHYCACLFCQSLYLAVIHQSLRCAHYAHHSCSLLQQSTQVRRIKDDAAAASHTVDAVHGNLPSSSSADADRQPTALATPSISPASVRSAANGSAAAASIPKPKAAGVTVKPKGPQVLVKAKRKAEEAPPEAAASKSTKLDVENGASTAAAAGGLAGLAGLAAYGSDSGSASDS